MVLLNKVRQKKNSLVIPIFDKIFLDLVMNILTILGMACYAFFSFVNLWPPYETQAGYRFFNLPNELKADRSTLEKNSKLGSNILIVKNDQRHLSRIYFSFKKPKMEIERIQASQSVIWMEQEKNNLSINGWDIISSSHDSSICVIAIDEKVLSPEEATFERGEQIEARDYSTRKPLSQLKILTQGRFNKERVKVFILWCPLGFLLSIFLCRARVIPPGWIANAERPKKNVTTQPGVNSNPFQDQQQAMDNYEKAVFVSYAWGGESESVVDGLERAFAERGIPIVRDKKDLEYKGSIEAFEQRIGKGQCVVLVISDNYLRSEHCMYELVEVKENRDLRERIFPIVLADVRIYRAIDRVSYIQHWDGEIKKLDQAIKNVDRMTNLGSITADLDKYARIRGSLDHLTGLLSDMNALTPEMHADSGFSTLISAVGNAMGGKQTVSRSGKVTAQPNKKSDNRFEGSPGEQ